MIKKFLTWMVICIAINTYVIANAQEAFLKRGTIALNPEDRRTLFLYIPGYTLLYDLGETTTIRSRSFGTKKEYQYATTQDGIQVLVRKQDIGKDVEILKKYNFLVNRRMPLCETETDCGNIWNNFPDDIDETSTWSALWRSAGNFLRREREEDLTREVKVSVGAVEQEGFIPTKRHGIRLEDVGFISLLDQKYPLYRFQEKSIDELNSDCGQESIRRESLFKRIEVSAKASATVGIGINENTSKTSLKRYVGSVLSFLGLRAVNISAETVVEGETRKEINDDVTITYGNKDQQWLIKTVNIEKRSDMDGDSYQPFGTVMIKKVFKCEAGHPTEIMLVSFLSTFASETPENIQSIININPSRIKELELKKGHDHHKGYKGLVSANSSESHSKLIDFFLGKDISKSVANLFIKEINVAVPQ